MRIALGAGRSDIVGLILRQCLTLSGAGLLCGLVLAAVLSRLLGSLLFGVPPLDVVAFGGAVILFLAVGLAAGLAPASRAIRVDPVVALRWD